MARSVVATVGAVALLGVGIAVPTVASAVPAQARGDSYGGCAIPAPPRGAKKIDQFRSDGVRHQTYKTKAGSPYTTVLYYKQAGKWRGYRTTTWGGGTTNVGPNAGSGWGITMRKKACGYLSIDAGAAKGKKTYFNVCIGKTSAVTKKCRNAK
ncbi:MAG: hypothetical protein ACOYD0_00010 [Candidatus Nanopelagicales bacterium]